MNPSLIVRKGSDRRTDDERFPISIIEGFLSNDGYLHLYFAVRIPTKGSSRLHCTSQSVVRRDQIRLIETVCSYIAQSCDRVEHSALAACNRDPEARFRPGADAAAPYLCR